MTPREYAESQERKPAAAEADTQGTAPATRDRPAGRDRPGNHDAAGSRHDAQPPSRPGREPQLTPQREGTAPPSTPARTGNGGQPGAPHDRGPAARADVPAGRRPDVPAGPPGARHHPFPGQRERPRPEALSADNRSPAQLRCDRQSTTPREYAAIKEKETAVRAAAKETPAKNSAQAVTQRGSSPRDQGRPGSDRAGENTSPGRDASGPDPGNSPDTPTVQRNDKGTITHAYSEVRGQKLDFYTDGTHWVSGDAVRAARAEAERKPGTQRHDITDIPPMREQGRNIIGAKPERSPGDTADLPPTGEQLLEPDDGELPRPERLGRAIDRGFDGIKDSATNLATTMQELWDTPGTGGHAASIAIPKGPEVNPVPFQSPDVGSIVELGVVAGVLAWHAYHRTRDAVSELSDKISEWRDNQHAGN